MTDTANRVKKIVAEHLGVEESKVTDNASFIDDLGADSLDTVELVMAFEEEYGVEIPSEELENITTVGAVIKYMLIIIYMGVSFMGEAKFRRDFG